MILQHSLNTPPTALAHARAGSMPIALPRRAAGLTPRAQRAQRRAPLRVRAAMGLAPPPSNPAFRFGKLDEELGYSARPSGSNAMTLEGTVTKGGMLLTLSAVAAAATWMQVCMWGSAGGGAAQCARMAAAAGSRAACSGSRCHLDVRGTSAPALALTTPLLAMQVFAAPTAAAAMAVMGASKVAGIGALISAIAVMFKPQWAPTTAPIYAICQGVALAGMSAMLEMRWVPCGGVAWRGGAWGLLGCAT